MAASAAANWGAPSMRLPRGRHRSWPYSIPAMRRPARAAATAWRGGGWRRATSAGARPLARARHPTNRRRGPVMSPFSPPKPSSARRRPPRPPRRVWQRACLPGPSSPPCSASHKPMPCGPAPPRSNTGAHCRLTSCPAPPGLRPCMRGRSTRRCGRAAAAALRRCGPCSAMRRAGKCRMACSTAYARATCSGRLARTGAPPRSAGEKRG